MSHSQTFIFIFFTRHFLEFWSSILKGSQLVRHEKLEILVARKTRIPIFSLFFYNLSFTSLVQDDYDSDIYCASFLSSGLRSSCDLYLYFPSNFCLRSKISSWFISSASTLKQCVFDESFSKQMLQNIKFLVYLKTWATWYLSSKKLYNKKPKNFEINVISKGRPLAFFKRKTNVSCL